MTDTDLALYMLKQFREGKSVFTINSNYTWYYKWEPEDETNFTIHVYSVCNSKTYVERMGNNVNKLYDLVDCTETLIDEDDFNAMHALGKLK